MDNNITDYDKRRISGIQVLLEEYDNNIYVVEKILKRRLIVSRIFGYAAIIGACGWIVYLINAIRTSPSYLIITNIITLLLVPVIICFVLSIILICNNIKTKRMIKLIHTFNAFQYNKDSPENQNASIKDTELVVEIKNLLDQYNNDANRVRKALKKRLIICCVLGCAVTPVACYLLFIVVATSLTCKVTTCPVGTLDIPGFLTIPAIVTAAIAIAFFRSAIRTKRLLEKLSSFDVSQFVKESSGNQNTLTDVRSYPGSFGAS